jgi:hypothetical protein
MSYILTNLQQYKDTAITCVRVHHLGNKKLPSPQISYYDVANSNDYAAELVDHLQTMYDKLANSNILPTLVYPDLQRNDQLNGSGNPYLFIS